MMDWLIANWEHIAAAFGMLVAVCSTIVKLTKTTKDDAILAKIIKWCDVFSIVFTKNDAKVIADALKKEKKAK